MAETDDVNLSELMKMKVAELKRELKARGLSTVGNKNELIERLQGGGEEEGSAVRTSRSSGESDSGHGAAIDADVIDETGNHDESELLDEDDVLEDGLDDELSVEGTSETNDSTVGGAISHSEKLDPLNSSVSTEQPVKPSKRKLMSASKKTDSTGPPKKITLNRNSAVSTATSEKENQESVNQEKLKSTIEPMDTNGSSLPKKVVKLSSFSIKERLELRAQKFGAPVTDTAKKEARAVRFGLGSSQTSSSTPVASAELLKKRAERFGTTAPPAVLKKTELEEKLKLRQQRFGVVTTANSNISLPPKTKADLDEKKRLRAERFKSTTD